MLTPMYEHAHSDSPLITEIFILTLAVAFICFWDIVVDFGLVTFGGIEGILLRDIDPSDMALMNS